MAAALASVAAYASIGVPPAVQQALPSAVRAAVWTRGAHVWSFDREGSAAGDEEGVGGVDLDDGRGAGGATAAARPSLHAPPRLGATPAAPMVALATFMGLIAPLAPPVEREEQTEEDAPPHGAARSVSLAVEGWGRMASWRTADGAVYVAVPGGHTPWQAEREAREAWEVFLQHLAEDE